MIPLSKIQQIAIRYGISLNMSIVFGLITAGLINSIGPLLFGYLPMPLFVISAACGLIIAAIFASTMGPMSFNVWAIIAGWLTGVLSALALSSIEIVPYSIVGPLILTTVVTTVLTLVIQPKPFPGSDRLLMIIHVISIFIVAWGIVYSLGTPWLRPLGLIFAIDTFALWNPAIVGGCPLTFLESRFRKAQGQQTELGQDRFVKYYLKKWLRIEITSKSAESIPRVIAVVLFSWWIVDYLIH